VVEHGKGVQVLLTLKRGVWNLIRLLLTDVFGPPRLMIVEEEFGS
jgi:hypothetical protein